VSDSNDELAAALRDAASKPAITARLMHGDACVHYVEFECKVYPFSMSDQELHDKLTSMGYEVAWRPGQP
jgi:hypothetical protein